MLFFVSLFVLMITEGSRTSAKIMANSRRRLGHRRGKIGINKFKRNVLKFF